MQQGKLLQRTDKCGDLKPELVMEGFQKEKRLLV